MEAGGRAFAQQTRAQASYSRGARPSMRATWLITKLSTDATEPARPAVGEWGGDNPGS